MTTANVDAKEIQKFSDLSHQWWDTEGELHTLHALNPLRLQWIRSIHPLTDAHVLDVGCGGGILSESMATHAQHVTGIDLAEKSVKIAKLHALETGISNLDYQAISIEALAEQQTATFDVVTCMEMLEHVPDPASIVRSIASTLKSGGWAFFSTINRNTISWLKGIVAAEYVFNVVPRGTHHFDKLIAPAELASMARNAGLHPAKSQGLKYNPLTRRFTLHPDTSVNYFLACQKT